MFTGSLLTLAFPYLAGSMVDAAVLHTQGGVDMTGVNRTALLLMAILAVQAGARGLEKESGGMGILLSGVTGAVPARVCVIGAGVAGRSAARVAAAIGADVTILDISREQLERAKREIGGPVETHRSSSPQVNQ